MERIDDRVCAEARPYLVVATGSLMTSWGNDCGAVPHGTSVAAWACYSQAQRQRVAEIIRERPEMKRVRLVDDHGSKYRPRGCGHFHIYATEPDECTPEYSIKHLCELAVRNERDLYNAAMIAFRAPHPNAFRELAYSIDRRVTSPRWSGGDPVVASVGLPARCRIALEVAHEYRASLLSDDRSCQFLEAI